MNEFRRMIKEMDLVSTAAIGAAVGFIIGFIRAIWEIAAHRCLQYKMFKLTALAFQGIALYMIYFALGLILVHGLGFLVIKAKKKDQATVFRLDTLVLILAIGLLIVDRLLREFTYYTLGLGIERFFKQISALFTTKISIAEFFSLIKKNKLAFIFIILGIVVITILIRLTRRLKWDRVSLWVENRARGLRRTALVLVILVLVLYAAIFFHGQWNQPQGPNILLIVVDCLRADHLGCYGYQRDTSPELDRLAKQGLLFQRAYSITSWTKPAVVSLFTSLYPNRHGVTAMSDIVPSASLTMAEILKNKGYHTYCLIGGNSFLRKAFNYQQGFDVFVNGEYKDLSAAVLTKRFLSFLGKWDSSPQKPFFAYLHFMDVHLPYHKNKYNQLFAPVDKQGQPSRFEPGAIGQSGLRHITASMQLANRDKEQLISLYDGQVRFVDEQIGKIVSALKKNRLLKNTLVVVTADHGEEFWDHYNVEHGHTLYQEIIHIPLMMAGTRLPVSKINRQVSIIDILPTVLKQANAYANTFHLQGTCLLKKLEPKQGAWIFSMGTLYGSEKYGLIDQDNWKLVVNTTDQREKGQLTGYRNTDSFELYDLNQDPLEKENRKDSEPGRLSRLKLKLDQLVRTTLKFKRQKRAIDKKTEDQLKSLGYI